MTPAAKRFVFVLRNTRYPLDTYVVGVYTTRARAKAAWARYLAHPRGWKRDVGGRPDEKAGEIRRHRFDW